MSIKTLEKAILRELQNLTKNPKLKLKNIQYWSTSEIEAQGRETLIYLPKQEVWVAYE